MLITNVIDYLHDGEGKGIENMGFHIEGHEFYKELNMPFYFDISTGLLLDASGELAVITYELIANLNWEVIEIEDK